MSGKKILIVEDELLIAMHLKNMLKTRGFEVLDTISTGEDAIVKTEELNPDIILIDILLKGEIDGISAAEKIKARHDIPIIYMTAHSDEKTLDRAKATGPHGYILKPVNQKELYSTIEITLYKHEMERKLKESEDRYKSLIEQSPVGIGTSNIDGSIISLNKKMTEITGYTFEESQKISVTDTFVNINERNIILKELIRNGRVADKHARLRRKNGDIYDALLSISKIYIGNEELYQTVCIDITDQKKTEAALQEKTNFLDKLIESSALSTWISDENGTAIRANLACLEFFGAKEEEVIGKYNLFKDIVIEKKGFIPVVQGVFDKGEPASIFIDYDFSDVDHVDVSDATHKSVNSILTPILGDDGNVTNVIVQTIDLTDIKKAEVQIKASLREKEILLQEIHHRVKNNMQIISSLLSLQSDYIRDEKNREIFTDSQNRVHSMAMVHEHLYQSVDLSKIEFTTYIRELTSHLLGSYKTNKADIRIDIQAEGIYLDITRAIPCGMLINELVSNSLKYAFPKGRKGKINIDFKIDNKSKYTISVADNGIGLADNFDYKKTESLGLKLVNAFTQQLDGKIEHVKSKGTKFVITFPR